LIPANLHSFRIVNYKSQAVKTFSVVS
jgi:hypothetical protein